MKDSRCSAAFSIVISCVFHRRLAAAGFLLLASFALVTSGRASVLSWSGGGGANAYWNNSANWGFAGTPGNGDTVVFPASQPNLINTNNITGLVLNQIRFAGAGGGYDLRGNAFTLTNSILATNTVGADTIENGITLATATNVLIVVSNNITLTLDGNVGGSGTVGVTKAGLGTLLYQGPGSNTYPGATVVAAGTLQLNAGGINAVSGPLVIGDGTGAGSPTVIDLQLEELSSLPLITINLSGTLNLNNNNEPSLTSNLVLSGGTITTGTGLLTLPANCTITLTNAYSDYIYGNLNDGSGTLTLQGSGYLYDYAITSGSANLVQNGSVSTLWEVANTYSGNYTANGSGYVDLLNSQALGNVTNQMTLNGQSYVYVANNVNITNQSVTINSSASTTIYAYSASSNIWNANFILNAPFVVDAGAGSSLNINGTISGSGSLAKTDSGVLELSGSSYNSYFGPTEVVAGTLLLNKAFATTAVCGQLIMNANTTARLLNHFQINSLTTPVALYDGSVLDLNGFTETMGPLTIQGAQITMNGGTLYFNNSITVNSSSVAESVIGGGSGILYSLMTITNNGHNYSPDLLISANLSSSGATTNDIFKDGTGEVALTGNNTFTGPVIVHGGNLWAETSTALGNTNTPATVYGAGGLFLDGNGLDFGLKPLILVGPNSAYGELTCAGSNVWRGNVTLTNISTIDVYTNSSLTLAGAISGNGGITKIDTGTLIYSGAAGNTYAGLTQVSSGELDLAKGVGALAIAPFEAGLAIGDGTDAASVVYRAGYQMNSLITPVMVNNNATLNLNGFSDVVSPLTLSNGVVTTSGGQIGLSSVSATGYESFIYGTVVPQAPALTLSLSAFLTFYANIVSNSTAGLIKTGAAIGGVDLMSSNSYAGPTVIQTGYVRIFNDRSLGLTNSPVVVSNDAALVLWGGVDVTNKPLVLNGTDNSAVYQALEGDSGVSVWAGPVTNNANSILHTYDSTSELHINGLISGAGGLELSGYSSGGGTFVFEGTTSNSYAGPTIVDALNTLQLNKSILYGAVPGNVIVNGTLRLTNNEQINPGADVLVNGGGLFDFGSFYQDINTLHGTGNITFGNFGYLNIGVQNGSSEFDGIMSGTGYPGGYTVGKNGSGTFTMTGNNTYLNRSDVAGGTLIINGFQPQNPVSVYSGGAVGGSGTVGIITASGIVAPGNNPSLGVLNSSNVTFSSSGDFKVEIAGLNPGTGYDQLNVTGTVSLASAKLQLNMPVAGATNTQLTILNNKGTSAVTGTFAGLPEGATVTADNGAQFKISYQGGNGKSVVLTQVSLPSQPKLTGITKLGGGSEQLNGTGFTNLAYTVEANTNLATATWVNIGTATANGSGQIQFIDPNAASFPIRFYRFSFP